MDAAQESVSVGVSEDMMLLLLCVHYSYNSRCRTIRSLPFSPSSKVSNSPIQTHARTYAHTGSPDPGPSAPQGTPNTDPLPNPWAPPTSTPPTTTTSGANTTTPTDSSSSVGGGSGLGSVSHSLSLSLSCVFTCHLHRWWVQKCWVRWWAGLGWEEVGETPSYRTLS